MHVIARKTLVEFWARWPEAEPHLAAWFREAEQAAWATPQDIKAQYATASIIGSNRVVFNIRGNRFRLVVHVCYRGQRVYVRFIGTHAEYDAIDAETI
ncbi:MAG: type II toxin-antitoxin system HigB family toxin [Armatimonadetes bacterium]|nr:type II toxin-antitoxin system HigB family toxin [Armatimonadota bacterium]